MKLITRHQKAASAETNWYKTYSKSETLWNSVSYWPSAEGRTKREIHEQLVDLGLYPSPEDVNKVVGNTGWTDICCDECNELVEEVVQLGQEPDYESSTTNICFPCLKKAVQLK